MRHLPVANLLQTARGPGPALPSFLQRKSAKSHQDHEDKGGPAESASAQRREEEEPRREVQGLDGAGASVSQMPPMSSLLSSEQGRVAGAGGSGGSGGRESPPPATLETWLVEVRKGLLSQNQEALSVALADARGRPDVKLCLVHPLTEVPSPLGVDLPLGHVDQRSVQEHECRLKQTVFKPLMAHARSKNVKCTGIIMRGESREGALAEGACSLEATTVYVVTKKSRFLRHHKHGIMDELLKVMPSGCRLIAMEGSRKVKEEVVPRISLVGESGRFPLTGCCSAAEAGAGSGTGEAHGRGVGNVGMQDSLSSAASVQGGGEHAGGGPQARAGGVQEGSGASHHAPSPRVSEGIVAAGPWHAVPVSPWSPSGGAPLHPIQPSVAAVHAVQHELLAGSPTVPSAAPRQHNHQQHPQAGLGSGLVSHGSFGAQPVLGPPLHSGQGQWFGAALGSVHAGPYFPGLGVPGGTPLMQPGPVYFANGSYHLGMQPMPRPGHALVHAASLPDGAFNMSPLRPCLDSSIAAPKMEARTMHSGDNFSAMLLPGSFAGMQASPETPSQEMLFFVENSSGFESSATGSRGSGSDLSGCVDRGVSMTIAEADEEGEKCEGQDDFDALAKELTFTDGTLPPQGQVPLPSPSSQVFGCALDLIRFYPDQVDAATDGFSEASLITPLPCAGMYKGHLLGCQVSIIRMHGELWDDAEVFQRQAEKLTFRLLHPNVATMMGFCAERKCIIYDSTGGWGTLAQVLRGIGPVGGVAPIALTWRMRLSMLSDVCQGLTLLHMQGFPVAALAVSADTVLVDAFYCCKISYAGFDRLATDPPAAAKKLIEHEGAAQCVLRVSRSMREGRGGGSVTDSSAASGAQGSFSKDLEPGMSGPPGGMAQAEHGCEGGGGQDGDGTCGERGEAENDGEDLEAKRVAGLLQEDVFAFGLLTLQVMGACEDRKGALETLARCWSTGSVDWAVDSLVRHALQRAPDWPKDVLRSLAHVALECAEENASWRPDFRAGVLPVLTRLAPH